MQLARILPLNLLAAVAIATGVDVASAESGTGPDPELPEPTARAWGLIDARDFSGAHPLLHPSLHWQDKDLVLRGRDRDRGGLVPVDILLRPRAPREAAPGAPPAANAATPTRPEQSR